MTRLRLTVPAALCAVLMAIGGKAFAASNPLTAKGTYSDYAFSTANNSFDPKDPINVKHVREGGGSLPSVMQKSADSVTIEARPARTVLTLPLGWYALDQGQQTKIFSPDEQTKLTLHFIDLSPCKSFDEFKQRLLKETKESMKEPTAMFSQFDLPDGSFALEVRNIETKPGQKAGLVSVYTVNPEHKDGQPAMSISMLAPLAEFSKYEGLLGLMLESRKISWK